mmetsp:Transcript_16575/g.33514  ORF Transcript_16575/g.33514 Transcript_16575/m.33514 type:complete len:203 (-) Transcript_16575:43-651(-)|eukprot:CAMPEP_0119063236 /NCGR_PEP_ID=MMETSP1178-20130426/6631_1 /TAXON_ID=33656 /ORGANISM="unid sp, Strain CCMP2000" /LENGTH=202 /DNA_ID=CAMNT_0007044593 /DNA_START=91 /DNA_END=699 /DNA_ORIENTATION=-
MAVHHAQPIARRQRLGPRKCGHGEKCNVPISQSFKSIPIGKVFRPRTTGPFANHMYRNKVAVYDCLAVAPVHLAGGGIRSAYSAPDCNLLYVTRGAVKGRGPDGTVTDIGGGPRYHDKFHFDGQVCNLTYVGNAKCHNEGNYRGIENNAKSTIVLWRPRSGKPFTMLGMADFQGVAMDDQGQPHYRLKMQATSQEIQKYTRV